MLFAIAGAFGYGLASVLQAAAARDAGAALRALARPLYLLGLVLDLLGWLCSLAALRTLPVAVVQPVLAGSLVVTAVAGWAALGARLRRADVAAMVLTVAALAVLATDVESAAVPRPRTVVTTGLLGGAVVLAGIGFLGRRRPAVAGTLAGVAFGGAALCARVLVLPKLDHGLTLVTQPAAWALAAFGGTGMLLYAAALERGSVGPVTALLWVAEIIAPTLAGALLFGDPGPRTPLALAALVVTVGAAVVLAHAGQADRLDQRRSSPVVSRRT